MSFEEHMDTFGDNLSAYLLSEKILIIFADWEAYLSIINIQL